MAEAFLARLPKVRRGTLGKEDQNCSICMEDYGTVPCASGTIERAVRLPCNHVFGSECISIWFTPTDGQRGHNTCPACRRVLFQMDPASTETGPFSDNEHDRIHEMFHTAIPVVGLRLSVSSEGVAMALNIANRIHDANMPHVYSPLVIVAVSLYMAGTAMDSPRSLEEIFGEHGVPLVGDSAIGADPSPLIRLCQQARRLMDEPQLPGITQRALQAVLN